MDLINRKKAIEVITQEYNRREAWKTGGLQLAWIESALNSVPGVVRCRDCRWKAGAVCTRFAEVYPADDDYCSRGEGRADGSD